LEKILAGVRNLIGRIGSNFAGVPEITIPAGEKLPAGSNEDLIRRLALVASRGVVALHNPTQARM